MYTSRTTTEEKSPAPVFQGMKLYVRHKNDCKHKKNRNHSNCGCPIWYQHQRRRWSAGTNNWEDAMKRAAIEVGKPAPLKGKDTTLVNAVEKYLVKRSKKLQSADGAP
ncbi:MAG: hypothetical protein WCA20_13200 [Candidatus Sulfotelmatobacter sp.]